MFLKERIKYDGAILHQRFAYQYFREKVSPLGNMMAFRGEMEVLADNMIDQEDVLQQAFIWSDDALNFIWELPVLGDNSFAAVSYQRLLNTEIANILSSEIYLNQSVFMKGDDMMVDVKGDVKKCSVSISYIKHNAALGHTGININAGKKAPDFAFSIQLSDAKIKQFAEDVIVAFNTLNQDMFVATTKIIIK